MPPVQDVKAPNRRLDSWKEIAAFFGRDERTVKRWEKERALPIHRLPGGLRARVFAFTEELERWMHSLETQPEDETPVLESAPEPLPLAEVEEPETAEPVTALPEPVEAPQAPISRKRWLMPVAFLLLATAAIGVAVVGRHRASVQAKAPTHAGNPEAQQLYLQGRYYWNKRTPQDLTKAVDFFTQAIVHDPNYAQAYVGLADSYNLLREYAAMPQREAYPRALAAAQKAVELDNSSAEAHTSLAFVELYWKWDVQGAEGDFRRAIKLNPEYATAHHWYANFLALAGRYPEALEEMDRAQQIDPGSSAIVADRALVLFDLGRTDEAVAILKGIENSQPSFYSAPQYLSYIDFSRRDFAGYIAESTKSAELSGDQSQIDLAHAAEQGYRNAGERGMLESMLKVYERRYQRGQGSPYQVALGHARLKENDQALEYLQKSYQQHDPDFLGIRGDSAFLALHDQAEFRALERKSGLPPLT